MELEDPNLPPYAQAWALAGADHINAWIEKVEAGTAGDPIDALASAFLSVVEEQARIIAEMSLRIDSLASR